MLLEPQNDLINHFLNHSYIPFDFEITLPLNRKKNEYGGRILIGYHFEES